MKFPNNTDAFAYRLAELVKHSEHADYIVALAREQFKAELAKVSAYEGVKRITLRNHRFALAEMAS